MDNLTMIGWVVDAGLVTALGYLIVRNRKLNKELDYALQRYQKVQADFMAYIEQKTGEQKQKTNNAKKKSHEVNRERVPGNGAKKRHKPG